MLAIVIVTVVAAFYYNDIINFFTKPVLDSVGCPSSFAELAKTPKGHQQCAQITINGLLAPFTLALKVSLMAGVAFASPVWLYQLWAFVAPGLYRKERRFAVPLLVSAILLFYVGVAFAYYFVFPVMFQFFAHTTPKGVSMMTDINNYLDFVLTMFFCFGLAFEVPVAVVLLVVMGLVRVESLAKNRGYVLIGIFILAALLTPPDAIAQCSLALPMYLLYEGGILMARLLARRRAAAEAAGTGDA
jgi:sec-independent protein translocase protein TatC